MTCDSTCTLITCKAKCDTLAAWAGDLTTGYPVSGCFAVDFNTADNVCNGYHSTGWPTSAVAATKECWIRDLSKAKELYWANGSSSTFVSTYMDHADTGKKSLATAAWGAIFTTLWTEWEPLLKTQEDAARVVSTAVKLKELYTT